MTTQPAAPWEQAPSWRARAYLLAECLRAANASIRAHALRSALTTLGIVIGVAAVIAIVGLVDGLSASISRQFEGLGSNMLSIRAETPLEDMLRGRLNKLKPSDLDQVRLHIDGVSHVTPIVAVGGAGGEVRNGVVVAMAAIVGTNRHYQDVRRRYPSVGRFLIDSDEQTRRKVVVLGDKLRRDLKLPEDPTGRFVQIGAEWFKVVGCMEARGQVFGLSQDSYVLMPYRTALAFGGVVDNPDLTIDLTVDDPDALEATRARATHLLRQLHNLKPEQSDDFAVETSDSLLKSFRDISSTVTLVVSGIVAISLVVAGVGIMNIMLVSVTERTQEIGVVKALGAPRQFILLQFLLEAVLLAVIGGVIGAVLGVGIMFGIGALIPSLPVPSVPWGVCAASIAFSALVGTTFGILPASNAANLKPVDALRHE